MEAYRRVYDSRHLQADCQAQGFPQEPYTRQSSMGYLYLLVTCNNLAVFWHMPALYHIVLPVVITSYYCPVIGWEDHL